jgi:hypothetical protein
VLYTARVNYTGCSAAASAGMSSTARSRGRCVCVCVCERERERERERFIRNHLHNGVVSGAARGQALLGPMWAGLSE